MIGVGGIIYTIDFEKMDELICSDDSLKAQEIVETEVIVTKDEGG